MNLLIVSNMYPDEARPYNGIFVSEQVDGIRRWHPNVTVDVCFIDGSKGKMEYLKSILYVNRKINKGNYDLVHIHYGLSGLFMLLPCHKKVKSVVTFHGCDIQPQGDGGKLTRWISRQVSRRCDCCIILNKGMKKIVDMCNKNNFIIPCSVDCDTFRPAITRPKNRTPKIVFPSKRNYHVKNYPLFADVLSILCNKYGMQCEEVELSDFTRQQIAEIFNEADLMLMTSRSEGSPQVVKEAMACNLPVVSTPVGDVKELLDGVKDCYVSKEHDAEELAALVVKALAHTGSGIAGLEKIKCMQLDSKSVTDRIYHIYQSLTNEFF